MTATDREATASEMAQLVAANLHLTAELARTRQRLDSAVEATGRALAAAQRGNAVAQAVIRKKAAQLRWTRDDTPATRTALKVACIALDEAITDWQRGQK